MWHGSRRENYKFFPRKENSKTKDRNLVIQVVSYRILVEHIFFNYRCINNQWINDKSQVAINTIRWKNYYKCSLVILNHNVWCIATCIIEITGRRLMVYLLFISVYYLPVDMQIYIMMFAKDTL
jgi:hypothetical protein